MSNNLYHVAQLGGDARIVATECMQRWPNDFLITDSRRDTHDQAQRMARNCFKQRYWVFGGGPDRVHGTYAMSKPAQDCHEWSITHLSATAAELESAFVSILDRQTGDDLRKLSRHLAPITGLAHAFDCKPLLSGDGVYTVAGIALTNFLRSQAAQRGGRFLEREGGLIIWHWQARD